MTDDPFYAPNRKTAPRRRQPGERLFVFLRGPGAGRYTELTEARRDGFNSHWPMAGRYRQMLAAWRESADKTELTKDDIVRIIAATR